MADPMENERGGNAVNAMVDQAPAGSGTAASALAGAPAAPQTVPQAAPQTAPRAGAPAAPAQAAGGQVAGGQVGGTAAAASPSEAGKVAARAPTASAAAAALFDTGRIQSIKVKVQAMLGGATLTVSQLSEIRQGDTVSLNSKIGDPVQILANGQLIGHGQLVVIESDPPSFGIRLESLVDNG